MIKTLIHFSFLFSIFCAVPFTLVAQKNKQKEPQHKLVFNIKDCKDDMMFLTLQFKDKFLLKDSANNSGNGVFIFEGGEKYDEGMYSLISGDSKARLLDFIMDGSQMFTFYLDTALNIYDFSVVGSPENSELLRFQQKSFTAKKQIIELSEKRKEFEEKELKDSAEYYLKKMKEIDAEMEQFITELIDANPNFLFSKMQKSFREIEIPEAPANADGSIDSSFRAVYYRTHYWENFDLTDRRFLFLPSYDPKLTNYFKKILWFQERDTITKYMDLMLDKTRPDSLMFRYLIEFLSREFETSKIIDHDAIFVHLVNNNQLAGKCIWMDEDLIKKYKQRIEDIEPMLIGKKSVEMIIPDTSQTKWYSSYNLPKKYRILWFYDHKCSHCQKDSKELKAVYDSLASIGELNFDVYAVNQTEDIAGWKKYIRENNYSWINVGGTTGNVDWKKEYHILQNPQFYIINQDKNIILNKNIPKDMIPKFLEDHEKIEAEKARLKKNK